MKVTWAEVGKAKKLLGWEPKVDLREGLKRTVEWALENIDLVKQVRV
jgi:nucleoside-diphosphate-sugar epimerase